MATKYPIVLVHGIVLKDLGFFRAFGRIERLLSEEGNVVYTARIDGFGTIETNARQLKDEVLRVLDETGAERVNLIAHSKGGLDCKYMIRELGMEDRVATLTTLCTPHKGSPIATNILRLPRPLLAFIAFWINLWYRIFGDKHPDALAVCRQLALCDEPEAEAVAFSDRVFCQSYSTTLERSRDDFVMGIPLLFSHHFEEKASDGLVSTDSSAFAHYKGSCLELSVSHTEIVDFLPKKHKRERIHRFYTELCRELGEMGF